ncbi:hypothetical protein [Leptolyngbya sp. FACHB-17]|uniref:hypothetical protein n=1 Tax=unclassified Leptolyngbya TaxID=2650499 RepID=UPI001681138C|nr:hypothetical protein [Leptolyngbya sp. FACHB-17]MBD2078474.1 hypothetical protein [Leptolyngbya sp. FACHB-17]
MPKVKRFYQGEQLSLFPDLLNLKASRFAMCDIEPKTIRFSTGERSQKVRVGLVIVQNDSGCVRVRYLEAGEMHQTDVSPDRILPLERARVKVKGNQADIIQDAIARLEIERDTLRAEGTIAPEHCWIETGKVKGRQFRQAWWRSTQAMFDSKRSRGKVKSCYIGEEGSPEHQEAKRQKYRRDRLKEIDRHLEMLMKCSET